MREGCERDFSTRVREDKRVNEISVDSSLVEAERSAVPSHTKRELSSAGLEHLPYKQRVGGSNPSAPTRTNEARRCRMTSFFLFLGLRQTNLFVGRGTENKRVDLSTSCEVQFL